MTEVLAQSLMLHCVGVLQSRDIDFAPNVIAGHEHLP